MQLLTLLPRDEIVLLPATTIVLSNAHHDHRRCVITATVIMNSLCSSNLLKIDSTHFFTSFLYRSIFNYRSDIMLNYQYNQLRIGFIKFK